MSKDTEQITPLAAMRKVGITHAFETLLWAPRKHVDYTCLCQASELSDMIDQRVMLFTAAMAPLFVVGVIAGSRFFAYLNDQRFRRFTMVFMLLVSTFVLLA